MLKTSGSIGSHISKFFWSFPRDKLIRYGVELSKVIMELIINIYIHGHNNWLQWMRPIFVLASATIEVRVQNDGTDASSSSVPTHQQSPSINIY
jgi:hypothetical protein